MKPSHDDYYGELVAHPDGFRAVGWESLAAATERYRVVSEHIRDGDRVLDLGAGLGELGRYLAACGKGCDYLGLERDARLVERGLGMSPLVALEVGDLFEAPLEVFDVVAVIGALVDGGPLRDDGVRFGRLRRLIAAARKAARREVVLVLLDQDLLEEDPIRSLEPALGGIRSTEIPWLAPDALATRVLSSELLVVMPGLAPL